MSALLSAVQQLRQVHWGKQLDPELVFWGEGGPAQEWSFTHLQGGCREKRTLTRQTDC